MYGGHSLAGLPNIQNQGQQTHLFNLMVLQKCPHLLKEVNVVAITEIYENLKYQCSNCGLRFIRNEQLKAHLDKHFESNNNVRRKKKVNPLISENRPLANGFMNFVT